MKITQVLLVSVLINLFSSVVYANELLCQYTTNETYKTEITKYFIDDREANISEPFASIVDVNTWKEYPGYNRDYKFTVKNNINYPLNLTVTYILIGKSNSRDMHLDPLGYEKVQGQYPQDQGGLGEISLDIHSITTIKYVVSESKEVCKKCLGIECLNDGSPCTNPMACGGQHCVEGYCSKSKKCFNNDCKCSQDEFQCEDNTRCVKRISTDIGSKPICSFEECTTKYIDPKTSLCAKSPEQIAQEEKDILKKEQENQQQLQREENQRIKDELVRKEKERTFLIYSIIGLVFIILFGICVIWHLRNKHEKEKQRTIETKTNAYIKVEEAKQKTEEEIQKTLRKEIDRVNAEITYLKNSRLSIRDQIENGKKEVNRLKEHIRKAKNSAKVEYERGLSELEKIQDERKERLRLNEEELSQKEKQQKLREKEFEKNNNEFLTKKAIDKYEQRYHNKLYLDKENGYLRFKSNNEFLHIYLYKNNFGLEKEFEVHHIDADKLNDDLWNLIAIPENEHRILNHATIRFRDWNSGIKQLQDQLGMKKEDFPEHIQNHMKDHDK